MKSNNFRDFLYKFGDFIGWSSGVIIIIWEITQKGLDSGAITKDYVFWFGLILFIVACVWYVFKAGKKAKESESKVNRSETYKNVGNGNIFKDSDNNTMNSNNTTTNITFENGKKKDIETERVIKEILGLLSSFEKKFELARHSSDSENNLEIFKETEFELHKIGTEYLPKTDLLLDNSEQLKDTFNDLFRYCRIYGFELQNFLDYIKAGRVGEEIVIQTEISLRTDNGKAYSQVRKYANLFRQQLKDRLP